jgi:hypothetical protein
MSSAVAHAVTNPSEESSDGMGSRRAMKFFAMVTLVAVVLAVIPSRIALAVGEQYGANDSDIQMNVDYRWAGGSVGGYYPIRIALQNRGLSRELELTFRPLNGAKIPVVSRRISIDQNASASLTLLIPLAGDGNFGSLTVSHDGRELEKLQNTISLPDIDYQDSRPALLGISRTPLAMQPLEDAITSLTTSGHGGRISGRGYGKTQDNQTVEPFRLPETWLAYSSVDLVAISMDVLGGLPESQKAAILDWTRAGGTLLVFSVGEPIGNSRKLAQLTEADSQSAAVKWQDARPGTRTRIPALHLDAYGNPDAAVGMAMEVPLEEGSEAANAQNSQLKFTWPEDSTPFEIRDFGQGRLIGFVENPFTGTIQDWGWLLKSFPFHEVWQTSRLGVAGRMDNTEFLQFLIVGIRSVPVTAFLVFISLFTLVIGPLNYFVLARKKKLNFLVVTIPALAVVTSVFLFGYSALSHGFSVKSRVRSLTMIDQGNNKAVTTARLVIYAGMTPSDGLSFSPSTAVIPIRATGEKFESARTDWTETQWLRSGWLRSRTRTQFLTKNVRPERGRLTVGAGTETELPVTNGLEWGITSLIVTDQGGDAWFGSDLSAGSGRPLKPITKSNRLEFCDLIDRSAPAIPEELEDVNNISSLSAMSFFPGGRSRYSNDFHVSQGKMERTIAELRLRVEGAASLPSNTYYAIVRDAPSIEFGTEVDVVDGWHLVIGSY